MAITKPNIQIDDEVRPMTDEEYTAYKADLNSSAASQVEYEAKMAARQSALAKLPALGLTTDEVASL